MIPSIRISFRLEFGSGAPQVRVPDHRGFVQGALFAPGDARALSPLHTLDQLLHDAPPGHGGFKFGARGLHLVRVKCDFGVLGVRQFTQMPLELVEGLHAARLDGLSGRHGRALEYTPALFLELAAVAPQRGMFAARERERLALDVLLAFADSQQCRVTLCRPARHQPCASRREII
jgi:hypothetical protein